MAGSAGSPTRQTISARTELAQHPQGDVGLLGRDEQIAWIVEVKELLHAKLAELEAYRKDVDVPFKDYLHDNAVTSIRARMDWLDRMLFGIMHGRDG